MTLAWSVDCIVHVLALGTCLDFSSSHSFSVDYSGSPCDFGFGMWSRRSWSLACGYLLCSHVFLVR